MIIRCKYCTSRKLKCLINRKHWICKCLVNSFDHLLAMHTLIAYLKRKKLWFRYRENAPDHSISRFYNCNDTLTARFCSKLISLTFLCWPTQSIPFFLVHVLNWDHHIQDLIWLWSNFLVYGQKSAAIFIVRISHKIRAFLLHLNYFQVFRDSFAWRWWIFTASERLPWESRKKL